MMLRESLESLVRDLGIVTQLLPAEDMPTSGKPGDTKCVKGCCWTVHGERHLFLRDNREQRSETYGT